VEITALNFYRLFLASNYAIYMRYSREVFDIRWSWFRTFWTENGTLFTTHQGNVYTDFVLLRTLFMS